jgi:hypothetical protein
MMVFVFLSPDGSRTALTLSSDGSNLPRAAGRPGWVARNVIGIDDVKRLVLDVVPTLADLNSTGFHIVSESAKVLPFSPRKR